MKYRGYYQDIKCSPYEAMFGQPMKMSKLPDDATEDIFTEEELDKAVGSGEHGDEQSNLTQDPVEEIHVETLNVISNDLVDNADMEGPVFVDVQEETGGEDLPSTEMVTEVARSPSMCFKHKNKIFEKRKTMKKKLETKAFTMTRLAREKCPKVKVGDTVQVLVPLVDRRRYDSRNILGVIMDVDLTKNLYKIETKDGILNSLYTRNQFETCTEGTVNISNVPTINVFLRECSGKASLFGSQGYKRCNCKT